MADTYTAALRLGKPEIGADEDTWGAVQAPAMDMIDEAVGGYVAISVASGDVTLSANNNATDQARNAVIKFTGSPGTDRTVTAPVVEKTYWLINGVGDSSNILFKATGGSAVTIPAGYSAKVYTDGTTTAVILFLIITGGIGASGPGAGQIKFPATQNASADANTLDDYEEGTFSPTITLGGAAVGVTYGQQIGLYTKVGRQVSFSLYVLLTSKGSSTGAIKIAGLPFTSNATANANQACSCMLETVTGVSGNINSFITAGVTVVTLEYLGTGTATTITDTNATNTSGFIISGSYAT